MNKLLVVIVLFLVTAELAHSQTKQTCTFNEPTIYPNRHIKICDIKGTFSGNITLTYTLTYPSTGEATWTLYAKSKTHLQSIHEAYERGPTTVEIVPDSKYNPIEYLDIYYASNFRYNIGLSGQITYTLQANTNSGASLFHQSVSIAVIVASIIAAI